jgi:predicted dehydrogenase
VRAVLSDIIKQRPDGKGGMAPCKTWDNATLLCEAGDPVSGEPFPWTMKVQRISPGERNSWYAQVLGTRASAKWSSVNPKLLEVLNYTPAATGAEQVWGHVQTGYEPAFKTITGNIFDFGFTDSIQQMWAGFLYELVHGKPLKKFAGCATPQEAALSHRLFTAALESQRGGQTVKV